MQFWHELFLHISADWKAYICGFCARDWLKQNEKEPDDVEIISIKAERNSLQVRKACIWWNIELGLLYQ